MQMQLSQDINRLLQQPVPLLTLESDQENEALQLLLEFCRNMGETVYRWSVTDGLSTMVFGLSVDKSGVEHNAEELLQSIKSRNSGGVYVLCDFDPFLRDNPKIIRLLKDIALAFEQIPKRIVLLGHRIHLPPELTAFSACARLALPTESEILAIIRQQARRYAAQNQQRRIRTDNTALQQLTASLRGMTQRDVARLAWHAIADDGVISQSDLAEVSSAKFALLNREGLLHYEYDTENFANVGGLDNLKQWLQLRQQAFSGDGKLDAPRGILLLGVQGGGKSLAARAVAGMWNLPLLRLDMGSLYNKYIGETEKNLRESLQQAEVMSPCVLWMDELEKALAQGGSDDGLSKRLLGYLLTWMADKKRPVFLVATSNNIQQLPAELVRKGRFDEIFFVDLPDAKIRAEIFSIHLRKRDIDPDKLQLARVAEASEGFSGAEIEQAVVSALYRLGESQPLREDHLITAILNTSPLSVVMAEQVESLRDWAEARAVRA